MTQVPGVKTSPPEMEPVGANDPDDNEVLQPDMVPTVGNAGRKQQSQVGQGLQRDPEDEEGDEEDAMTPGEDGDEEV